MDTCKNCTVSHVLQVVWQNAECEDSQILFMLKRLGKNLVLVKIDGTVRDVKVLIQESVVTEWVMVNNV